MNSIFSWFLVLNSYSLPEIIEYFWYTHLYIFFCLYYIFIMILLLFWRKIYPYWIFIPGVIVVEVFLYKNIHKKWIFRCFPSEVSNFNIKIWLLLQYKYKKKMFIFSTSCCHLPFMTLIDSWVVSFKRYLRRCVYLLQRGPVSYFRSRILFYVSVYHLSLSYVKESEPSVIMYDFVCYISKNERRSL